MSDTQQLAFRLSSELIARIDAHVERLRAEASWSNPNRAVAVRLLITAGLEQAERKTGRASARRTRSHE